ncbi:hypothetical protein JZ751_017176 [Albula glossodonta]|uniref:Uncharacterized protein n=1 Tax=Albula glossodonta TaxID=121402 RepID=A0A8T2NRH2_9TELE|nr:hypothetical protein JZ751_017176 [Albula glossodonta]
MRKRRESLSPDRFSLYSSLSSVSGGLTIFTTNSDIHKVSTIVQDNIAANKVTLLHVESHSISESNHLPFKVDSAVRNITLHVTGTLKHCVLTNPSGQTQSLLDGPGSLAELEHFQGLYRVRLLPPVETGQWYLSADAEGPVTLNAIGDSSVDFLYYFAEEANGTHPGLARVEGSPVAGVPTFLVLLVTSPSLNEVSFSHVTLLGANGESLLEVPMNSSSSLSSGAELVGRMVSVPREPFCVRLSGKDRKGNSLERVSTEMIQPTHVQIQVLSAPRLVPGHTTRVTFDVWNHGPARYFNLTFDDDHRFLTQTGAHRLFVGQRGSLRREVEMKTPKDMELGGAVTLTLTVRALDSADTNYAVVHLTVVPLNLNPPSCSPMRVEAACPPKCDQGIWAVSLAVTDRGRSSLASLQLSQGSGVLTLLRGESRQAGQLWRQEGEEPEGPRLVQGDPPLNVSGRATLRVRYSASCCSPHAELLVWNELGSMRRCHLTSSQQGAPFSSSSSASGSSALLSLLFAVLGFRLMT